MPLKLLAAISKYGGAGASAGYHTLLDAFIPASSVLKEVKNNDYRVLAFDVYLVPSSVSII